LYILGMFLIDETPKSTRRSIEMSIAMRSAHLSEKVNWYSCFWDKSKSHNTMIKRFLEALITLTRTTKWHNF